MTVNIAQTHGRLSELTSAVQLVHAGQDSTTNMEGGHGAARDW